MTANAPGPSSGRAPSAPLREVLQLARWAPSGDNTQPWWFEPTGEDAFRIHGFDTRAHCVYDLDGWASRVSIGALLETVRIAATAFGLRAQIEYDRSSSEEAPVFDARLEAEPAIGADPLAPFIESRSVQRRPLSTQPLSASQKKDLEEAVGPRYEIAWYESFDERWQMASLMFRSARIRLTLEEAYRVHAAVIEWHATRSLDRMPDAAVGLDPLSLMAMRWAMKSWPRTRFVSKYLGGTIAPRLQLDLAPGLLCAAHLAILRRGASASFGAEEDFDAGAAVQRLWLSAERLGLRHQPEITPLVFSRYADEGRRFTNDVAALRAATDVRDRLDRIHGSERRRRTVWIGRIGKGAAASARSLRLPLELLLAPRVNPASSDNPS